MKCRRADDRGICTKLDRRSAVAVLRSAVVVMKGPPVRRRAGKDRVSFEERLAEEARRYEAQAKELAPGPQRDDLMRKAHEAETTAQISGWLALVRLTPTK
jgi:hypothetical protein